MIWLWLGLAALLVVAAVCAAAVIVGAQSEERRGELRFDTPAARSALRRCNPARDVHYFGGQARCECGEVVYSALDVDRAIIAGRQGFATFNEAWAAGLRDAPPEVREAWGDPSE